MRAYMRLTLITAGFLIGCAMLDVIWRDAPAEVSGIVVVTAPSQDVASTIKVVERTALREVGHMPASTPVAQLAQVVASEGFDPAWSLQTTEAMTRALASTPLAHQSLRVRCARTLCEVYAMIPGYRTDDVTAAMAAIQRGMITHAISTAGLDDRDAGEISDAPSGGGGLVVRRYAWRRS